MIKREKIKSFCIISIPYHLLFFMTTNLQISFLMKFLQFIHLQICDHNFFFDLSNLVVEVVRSYQINDRDGYHLVSSGPIEIKGCTYPHTYMHDIIQSSKCDFTILESFGTCQEVEALQLLLMVMSGSHDSDKIPELIQIRFFSKNPCLFMVSLDVNSLLKYVWYFGYSLSKFQDSIFDWVRDSILVDSSPCKALVLNLGLECIPLIEA